uniref:Mediator of RNA polymerase II transcription subunit 10 n=1 Tax=Cyprinus carpio TaxID=7962 RepID=A0A8C1RTI6_CYPCA
MAEKFDNLEEHLEKFVENIRQLGIIVSDFQPSSQTGLNQKLLSWLVIRLQDIEKCRQQLHDINVPLEVFEYIDQGRNPQLYTKECLERALAKNEQVKGKIDTLTVSTAPISIVDRCFPGILLISELGKVFPEEMAKYKAIHGDDPPS